MGVYDARHPKANRLGYPHARPLSVEEGLRPLIPPKTRSECGAKKHGSYKDSPRRTGLPRDRRRALWCRWSSRRRRKRLLAVHSVDDKAWLCHREGHLVIGSAGRSIPCPSVVVALRPYKLYPGWRRDVRPVARRLRVHQSANGVGGDADPPPREWRTPPVARCILALRCMVWRCCWWTCADYGGCLRHRYHGVGRHKENSTIVRKGFRFLPLKTTRTTNPQSPKIRTLFEIVGSTSKSISEETPPFPARPSMRTLGSTDDIPLYRLRVCRQ